jgi:primosomal protein N' (replication factor Y)
MQETMHTFADTQGFVNVLLPMVLDRPLTYTTSQDVSVGQYVRVPFRNRSLTGIVWETDVPQPALKTLKPLLKIHDFPPLSPDFIAFLTWCADYTVSSMGKILKLALPLQDAFQDTPSKQTFAPPQVAHRSVVFDDAQKVALTKLLSLTTEHPDKVALLDGETGSGKTEVYLDIVAAALARGQQALIMLPEIALSTQMLRRFSDRFGAEPALWHSHLTPAKRRDTWRAIVTGQAPLVLGARSALFLPYPNLGVMVVDEEHESAYKQDDGVLYHARDMAVARGHRENVPVVLVSATPSLETWHHVERGKYHGVRLTSRYQATLPDVTLMDMRGRPASQGWLHETVIAETRQTLSTGKQALFFMNRRGYAPMTLCRGCGHRWRCGDCSSYLSAHKTLGVLQCHHCGYKQPMPETCPACAAGADALIPCGPGVERIAEELATHFPHQEIVIVSSDVLSTPKKMHETVQRITQGDVSLIVGTQMIGKGYHFPDLTLVNVVDGDMGLSGGDFRAGEKTWQMLHQIAGRAGRGQHAGKVLIQTFVPDHLLMQTLQHHDREGFYHALIKERTLGHWPPFTRLAALIVSGRSMPRVDGTCRALLGSAPKTDAFEILGPAPAPLSPLRGDHRMRFLVRCAPQKRLSAYMKTWLSATPIPPDVHIQVDMDPVSFV